MAVDCPVPCNICGSTDVEVIAERDRHGAPLRTTICTRCGLVWSNPRPAENEVRAFYSGEYRLAYKGRSVPSLRQSARSARGALDRCRALQPHLQAGCRALDVGAGGGEVVYVLRKLGFDARGLEPDEGYASRAREVLGVPVDTGFVQDATFGSTQFDLITMYHALEHVEDPVAILMKLRGWLRDEGRCVVEVPNVVARSLAPTRKFHLAHLYNFNRTTLEEAGRRAGLAPVETKTSPDEGNVIAVFKAAVPASSDADALRENYREVAEAIRGYTVRNYYLSAVPYKGPVLRLSAYIGDWVAARATRSARDVLDNVIGRSRGFLPQPND
jgi:SAM-dependent methyltransferase